MAWSDFVECFDTSAQLTHSLVECAALVRSEVTVVVASRQLPDELFRGGSAAPCGAQEAGREDLRYDATSN